ncbi:MAG: universal stress protein [Pseudomonadota bacterium]|nr:universal stress protein [Pseudomonadota bacterium]
MYQRILIVVDEGPVAKAAVDEGLGLAKVHGAEVLFFHVLPSYVMPVADAPSLVLMSPEQHRQAVEAVAARLLAEATGVARQAGVASQSAVGSDADAATCIATAVVDRDCDLLVVGSHGRNVLQRLIFGSLVVRLIPLVTVPMLVCKSHEEVSQAAQEATDDSSAVPPAMSVVPPRGIDLPPQA